MVSAEDTQTLLPEIAHPPTSTQATTICIRSTTNPNSHDLELTEFPPSLTLDLTAMLLSDYSATTSEPLPRIALTTATPMPPVNSSISTPTMVNADHL
jgi:hypothetical protein